MRHSFPQIAASYLLLVIFSFFAIYPITRIITIALRPGDQLLSTSLALIPAGATLANFRVLFTHTPFLRWLVNSTAVALVNIRGTFPCVKLIVTPVAFASVWILIGTVRCAAVGFGTSGRIIDIPIRIELRGSNNVVLDDGDGLHLDEPCCG